MPHASDSHWFPHEALQDEDSNDLIISGLSSSDMRWFSWFWFTDSPDSDSLILLILIRWFWCLCKEVRSPGAFNSSDAFWSTEENGKHSQLILTFTHTHTQRERERERGRERERQRSVKIGSSAYRNMAYCSCGINNWRLLNE